MVVLEHPEFRILGVNSLEAGRWIRRFPAVVDDEIYPDYTVVIGLINHD